MTIEVNRMRIVHAYFLLHMICSEVSRQGVDPRCHFHPCHRLL